MICCHDVEECEHWREQRLAGKRYDPNKCQVDQGWCMKLRTDIMNRTVSRPDIMSDELFLKGKRLRKCSHCGGKC